MKILKLILLMLLIIVLLTAALLLWLRYSPRPETKNTLTRLVVATQSQYFCKLIYPQFANCVKFDANQCQAIVEEQVNPCIQDAITELQDSSPTSQKLRVAINRCISQDLQQKLLHKYFNNTLECRAKFGFH